MRDRLFSRNLRSLTPVPVGDGSRPPLVQQNPSWWSLCSAWLHYHSVQLRWDVERQLARLLGRRWGA
ncbi:MAG: hypothetical protein ABI456_06000 [Ktedonobacteraceae bacterium]|nr:hypothetical protein [Chloroflexota bacterium]